MQVMNTLPSPQKSIILSLDDIALQKNSIKAEIAEQKKKIAASAQHIAAPFVQQSERVGFFSRTLGTGFTIIQGIFFGIKILRKIRSFIK